MSEENNNKKDEQANMPPDVPVGIDPIMFMVLSNMIGNMKLEDSVNILRDVIVESGLMTEKELNERIAKRQKETGDEMKKQFRKFGEDMKNSVMGDMLKHMKPKGQA